MTTIKESEALFAQGKIEEAEKCFLNLLKNDPKNPEILNNLGVIQHAKSNLQEAEGYFLKAVEVKEDYLDALLNLVDLYQEVTRWEDVTTQLEKCIAINTQEPNLYNQLGMVYLEMGGTDNAIKALNHSLDLNPYQEIVRDSLNALEANVGVPGKAVEKSPNDQALRHLLNEARPLQNLKTKIAVLCLPGLQSFLEDIVDFLKTKYQVRTCYSNNNQEIEAAIHWADVVWLEWANELTISLTNHPNLLDSKSVICRLHSYEALAGYVGKINWEKIDDLIFVAEHIKNIVLQQVANLHNKVRNIHIVPNGVNLDKFFFRDRSKGKNLAYLGHINYKKGPMLLLHAFRELIQVDKEYHLFIGGNFQDARYELYFSQMIKELGLEKNIHMDGWIKDVGAWLEDKHYIVCSSVLEGHPVALMEAMACGLKPVIHNFVGARDIYPEKYIWNTISEFIQIITGDDYSSIEYKNYIEKYYSLRRQLDSIDKIISNAPITTKIKNQLNLKKNKEGIGIDNNDPCYTLVDPEYPKKGGVASEDIRVWYNKFLGNLVKDHERQNPRHQRVKQTLEKIIKAEMKVLDIGCGTGISSKFMGELGAEVIGVDISDELIKFAKNKSAQQNVNYIVEDATQLNLQMSFDAITIIDSMEHIPRERVEAFGQSVYRHASKGTIIYLNIPDGRYQRYIKMNHPEKHQIVDEDYDPNIVISMFQKIGFQPYYISIYGLDLPVQYNEYLFMTDYALGNIYKQSFEKLGY